ncbi:MULTISPECIES: DUF3604 domain-containing protein [Alphaproteobacteria]|uniref:DUF3604 domain-containing protein n=1 Tax=Alphaproteobacteria TaxID=28211 RepID=UPI00326738FD
MQQQIRTQLIGAILVLSVFMGLNAAWGQSSAAGEKHPSRVFWGDTHLHTALSFDSYTFGTTGRPDLAYRYAKGFPVIHPVTGMRVQMKAPLDFLVIADHAELLGSVMRVLEGQAPDIAKTKSGKFLIKTAGNRTSKELDAVYDAINRVGSGLPNDTGLTPADLVRDLHGEKIRTAWNENIDAAEAHNDPGRFSAIIGWEWTSQPGGANFHRVVFMPQGGDVARKFLPFSTLESDDPEKLWDWLDTQQQKNGAEFVAIPHGPNISAGLMFGPNRRNGKPIDLKFAKTKSRFEVAIEVTQIKGDSETLPMFSPDDQFADYEFYNFLSTPDGKTPDPATGDYVRPGLRNGLALGAKLGVNPYKMGMAAGTDSHVGIPAIEETAFAGKSGHDSSPAKRPKPSGIGAAVGWDMGAAGFTGVWAEENTRRSIFDAFRRKEIYATTGPRLTVRFFGGEGFTDTDITGDLAVAGYSKGVPMGGDLAASTKAPTFLVAAMKDPNNANLDRVQIIKGWLNKDGTTNERIYDVALSDGRTDGKVAVGNTVDLKTGDYTNEIGASALSAVWKDPNFDPFQSAFYYARVLQIPTPRYSLLDSIALGIDVKETGRPATIQERAYTSPIWYTPKR